MKAMLVLFALFLVPSARAADTVESLILAQSEKSRAAGKAIYEKHCFACHAPTNIMVSSPKPGDHEDWDARLTRAGNFKNLVQSAREGREAMPAKGLCTTCDNNELSSAILYMMKGL